MIMDLGLEETIVLQCAKLNLSDQELVSIKNLILNNRINWGKLVNILFEHKVAVIVFENLKKAGVHNKIHHKWRHILELYCIGNANRNNVLHNSVFNVLKDLYTNHIKAIVLKGTMLSNAVYKDLSLRHSNDIDILIREKDIDKTVQIFKEHEFIQGEIISGELVPVPRSKMLKNSFLKTHELVPFIRKLDSSYCNYAIVDLQFKFNVDVKSDALSYDLMFEHAKEVILSNNNIRCFILEHEYNIIQLSSHLFEDATFVGSIFDRKDLEIIKFLDIFEYIRKFNTEINWSKLANLVLSNNRNHILYFALYFTEQIFGEFLPENFMRTICPENIDYLDMYAFEEKVPLKWKKSFMERLFDLQRKEEVDEQKDLLIETNKILNLLHL